MNLTGEATDRLTPTASNKGKRCRIYLISGLNDQNKSTVEEFMTGMDRYIRWYNQKRIKLSLGSKSPSEFRLSVG
jgi:hypothetical protein